MNISERFRTAIWQYRARGGRLYKLALDHGMSPSTLSAILTGARRVDADDARILAIGRALGLQAADMFEPDEVAVP